MAVQVQDLSQLKWHFRGQFRTFWPSPNMPEWTWRVMSLNECTRVQSIKSVPNCSLHQCTRIYSSIPTRRQLNPLYLKSILDRIHIREYTESDKDRELHTSISESARASHVRINSPCMLSSAFSVDDSAGFAKPENRKWKSLALDE